MIQAWPKQAIVRVTSWKKRYWLSKDLLGLVTLNQEWFHSVFSQDDNVRIFKDDKTTSVAQVTINDGQYVLKRYNARSQWHSIKRALRRSRARRCWKMSYAFHKAGLNVAPPILMYEARFGPFRKSAYFMTELLKGQELLEALPKMSHEQQAKVAQAVVGAFKLMAKHLITHGDMKASNLIWLDEKLYFIDLDASNQYFSRSRWSFSHNKDKKRFLKNWRDEPDLIQLFNDHFAEL